MLEDGIPNAVDSYLGENDKRKTISVVHGDYLYFGSSVNKKEAKAIL